MKASVPLISIVILTSFVIVQSRVATADGVVKSSGIECPRKNAHGAWLMEKAGHDMPVPWRDIPSFLTTSRKSHTAAGQFRPRAAVQAVQHVVPIHMAVRVLLT